MKTIIVCIILLASLNVLAEGCPEGTTDDGMGTCVPTGTKK